MKSGKPQIHNLPINDVTTLGAYAYELQQEAEIRGEVLPLPAHLHIGEPSFRTPEHIRHAAIEALQTETMTYGPAAGWTWLRELIVAKIERVNGYRVSPQQVAIAIGGTGAILAALMATVGAGDEVLIPDPHWPHYTMQLACCGATPVAYALDPQNGWLPEIADLEQLVTPRTRLLLINSPGNPTGAVYPAKLVEDLLDFARRHDLYLLSDESYDEILFEGIHVSPGALLSSDEFNQGRVMCVYTFSKTYAMTGWRIGYLATGTQLLKTITYVLDASYTNISTVIQRAAAAALTGPQDCVAQMRQVYQHRRDLAVSLLKELGRYVYTPHGAFYILVAVSGQDETGRRGRQFALDLLRDRNIAVAPGSTFGSVAENYVRLSLAASDEEIVRGVRGMCAFADGY